jgi:hypothetical protein
VVDAEFILRTMVPAIMYVPPPETTELKVPLNIIVEPAVAVKEPALMKSPPMFNVAFVLTTRVPEEATDNFAQRSPDTFTVIVIPAGMITLSKALGTVPSDQFAAISHAPVARAVLFAFTLFALKRTNNKKIQELLDRNFIVLY